MLLQNSLLGALAVQVIWGLCWVASRTGRWTSTHRYRYRYGLYLYPYLYLYVPRMLSVVLMLAARILGGAGGVPSVQLVFDDDYIRAQPCPLFARHI